MDYSPNRVMLYLSPENEDEKAMLNDLYHERTVLVNDSKILDNEGRLVKLIFKVYVRK